MPIVNRMADMVEEISAWRRDFHEHPELLYNVHRTAGKVADLLRTFGCDTVEEGIGRTGVVGVIQGRGDGGTIGLRADMDALPIEEKSGKPWASKTAGKMHACGHDGHTAMLLGAAKHLCETRNFAGRVVVIFQPAEEGGAGGRAMVEDGLMSRFGIGEVYGLHNMPGLPVGSFAIRSGPIMASTDEFSITIAGKGGHAAMPHTGTDTIVAGAHCVTALQTIVSRSVDPVESLVVSVTQFHGGTSHNILPDKVVLNGTIRALLPEARAFAATKLRDVVAGVCTGLGVTADVRVMAGYPVTANHAPQTAIAVEAARDVAAAGQVDDQVAPVLGGEDFSYMLEACPGAFIFMGNGDTAALHNPEYDFNDEAISYGSSYWVRLAETRLAAS